MRKLKDIIKRSLDKSGYSIQKKDNIVFEMAEFRYVNRWLLDYNIRTILDIGANEGQFATKISSLIPDAHLHCFEPLNGPFLKLQTLFASEKNVTVHNFALGDVEEELTINLNEFTPSSSFLKMDDTHKKSFAYAVNTSECKVKVKLLDNVAESLRAIAPILIKIDVQGFEDKVLAGGAQTIKKASIIIIEVSFKQLYEDQPLFDNIYQTLVKLGFAYMGNFEQLISPTTGEILQADALFIKQ